MRPWKFFGNERRGELGRNFLFAVMEKMPNAVANRRWWVLRKKFPAEAISLLPPLSPLPPSRGRVISKGKGKILEEIQHVGRGEEGGK